MRYRYEDTTTIHAEWYFGNAWPLVAEEIRDEIQSVGEVVNEEIGESSASFTWRVEADDLWNLYESVWNVLGAVPSSMWPDRKNVTEVES